MKLQSPLLRKFCARWNSRIPEVAVIRAVESVFPDLKKAIPPIDPFHLATFRRVKQIVNTELAFDGVISLTSSGDYVIQLSSELTEERRRFTVAHEIGHTLFFDLEDRVSSRFRVVDSHIESFHPDSGEERICNLVAEEILMPSAHFLSRIQLFPPIASTILQLSKEFKTSIHATSHRAVQLSPYKLIICMWEYKANMNLYETVWVVRNGHYKGAAQEKFIVTDDQPIFRAFNAKTGFRGKKWISLGGPIGQYFVDCIVLGRQAMRLITVFILETDAERLVGTKADIAASTDELRLF